MKAPASRARRDLQNVRRRIRGCVVILPGVDEAVRNDRRPSSPLAQPTSQVCQTSVSERRSYRLVDWHVADEDAVRSHRRIAADREILGRGSLQRIYPTPHRSRPTLHPCRRHHSVEQSRRRPAGPRSSELRRARMAARKSHVPRGAREANRDRRLPTMTPPLARSPDVGDLQHRRRKRLPVHPSAQRRKHRWMEHISARRGRRRCRSRWGRSGPKRLLPSATRALPVRTARKIAEAGIRAQDVELALRPLDRKPARRDDEHLRIRLAHRLPRGRRRVLSRAPEETGAPRGLDEAPGPSSPIAKGGRSTRGRPRSGWGRSRVFARRAASRSRHRLRRALPPRAGDRARRRPRGSRRGYRRSFQS